MLLNSITFQKLSWSDLVKMTRKRFRILEQRGYAMFPQTLKAIIFPLTREQII